EEPVVDPYSAKTVKMFVGKTGDYISVYGNSEHPNAQFFTNEVGFDWAFTASSHEIKNIAVAEVGLPPNTLSSYSRQVILEEYSIKNVFTEQIYELWPWIDTTTVQSYLYHTEAPGYFDYAGFVQGGLAPADEYAPLENIVLGLTPYNPKEIYLLEIAFKE
ncbi:MAG: hypothetical protein K8R53_06465, partial [Bacteroidales bacterium]|nr:hypothetical protein [Bacteroidales bacterium]